MTGTVLLIVHLGWMILLVILRKTHVLKVSGSMLFAAAFLPVFGELAVLSVCLEEKTGKMASRTADINMMDQQHVSQSIYHQKQSDHEQTVIPLEDALIIDDASTRRSIMMDILMDETNTYMSAMRQAQHSDDTEVVHYATTALTGMSEKADAKLQAANRKYQESQGDDESLDEYIRVLRQYLDDQIAQGELLEMNRKKYQELLTVRIRRYHDRDDYADLAESFLDSKNYSAASETLSVLEKRWRKTSRTLMIRLRYEFELGRGDQLQEVLRKVRQEDNYSPEVKEILDFWEEGVTHA